ncbi:SusC/RagA family TonB-linked outer membrane protein [Emticicia sp. 21SJ11W-3]|uniref:SusC/RagA family TonB-linked outer membrane protein n=1 Tax=Emticicia sp. 21SJ11W-3 TaxID=2916755 RepID=UPI0020A225AA|nr:SusC/RagA family TonB-linked outer membrane protein [Emticicia sp. 21SJ11W-3]UTA67987.1 SusC/RagA family TonB-linked outer membrane protein [Emticicia sp. 21SJ11W-3]
MRKLLLASIMLVLGSYAYAQNVNVTGKVTADDGSVLPGVSVVVKGTNQGVQTDASGIYKISAKKGASLLFSFIGFESQTIAIGNSSTIDVTLKADAAQLNEVVVTAQGIRKNLREVGYAYSKVSTEDVTVGRSPQLAQALSGKVTGLAVYNVNNSVDPQVKVVLRGFRSLTGNNEALIVLDGIQTTSTVLALINPNDIENISILKGGQAATLYGSAGINGALVITTKKGTKGKLKVNYSNSTNVEQISFLPEFQDKYGSGSHYYPSYGSAGYSSDPLVRMKGNWRSFENQQFGDPFDGSLRQLGRSASDGTTNILPYAAVKNARYKAFDTGVSMNNQIGFTGGDENGTYYMSLENQKIQGIVPGDKSERTGARVASSRDYNKLNVGFNASYTQAKYDRTNSDFYNDVINQPANLPLQDYRDWQNNKFANPNAFFNDYYNNPYFNADNQRRVYKDANISGTLSLTYKVTPWATLSNRLGAMNNSRTQKSTTGKFLYSDYAKTKAFIAEPFYRDGDGTGVYRAVTDILGGVTDYTKTENVINNEFQLTLEKDFGPFANKLILGNSVYQKYIKEVQVGSSSIVVPGVYNVSNRQGELTGFENTYMNRRVGYYADLSSNFKNWLILNGTFRYDQTSLFYKPGRPKNLWSYPYYGVALSFIPTDAFPSLKSNVLNYAKLRVNYNKNANDNIDVYGLDLTYPNGANFPFGNTVGLTVGNTLPDVNLKPESVTSGEIGGEFQLFNNRVNIDVSAYTQKSVGQVITVKVPNSTGFPNLLINVGETKNFGYEGEFKYLISKGTKFSWDASVRYSYNDNKVLELYPGINEFVLADGFSYANTNVIKGSRFPMLKTDGYQYAPDGSGYRLVSATTGYPLRQTTLTPRGGTLPRHIVGLGSRLNYGNFTFTFNFEYRGGNYMFSDLGRQMTFTGSGKWTENRTDQIFPNSAYLDDKGKVVPNTTVKVREPEYALWVDQYRNIAENFVAPAWFIKLRDINLSYSVPQSFLTKTKIFSGASIALYGRNLFTIVDKLNYYTDPEYSRSTGNGLGLNSTGQTPPVRQYGVNVNLTF